MTYREGRWLPDWPYYPGVTPQRTANTLLTGKGSADREYPGFTAEAIDDAAFFEQAVTGSGALAVAVALGGTKARAQFLVTPFAKNQPRVITASVAGVMGSVDAGPVGPTDYTGTGALAVAYTLSGSGDLVNQNLAGTGALAFAPVVTGAGVQSKTGTGALSVRATLSGTGTSTGIAPESTQKPAGGSTPRRRRIVEDDEESEQHETAEEVIERLLEASKAQATPQRRVIRRLARAAEVALDAPQMLPQVVAQADAVMARMDALAADRYMTDLILLSRLLDQVMAEAAEEDDEEALMLLL